MKSIYKIMLPILIMLCLTIEALCAGVPGNSTGDVFVRSIPNVSQSVKTQVTGGSATVILEDGTTVCASGIDCSNLVLSVLEISKNDASAWNWVKGSLSDQDKVLLPLQIYFENADGKNIRVSAATITIMPPNAYAEPYVYNLLTDGSSKKVTSTLSGRSLTFAYPSDGYIVITKHATTEPVAFWGDINSSGFVDSCDLVCLMHFLAGENLQVSNADIDDNGYIDLIDLVCLMKLLANTAICEYSARNCAPRPLKLSIHSGGIEHPCRRR